jgi:hypothetical protein
MKKLLLVLLLVPLAFAQEQDATKLEDQYKTCARHSIPAEKCTLEIYRQLKEKDGPTLDAPAREAVAAAMTYRGLLKNPESMQVRSATVVDFTIRKDAYHVVCLLIGGQNGFGGMTTAGVAYMGRRKPSGGLKTNPASAERTTTCVSRLAHSGIPCPDPELTLPTK